MKISTLVMVELSCMRGGREWEGRSQVTPRTTVSGLTRRQAGTAWSDLYRAADQREMNWTLARRQLSTEIRDIQLTLILLTRAANHSLAEVRNKLNLD